MYEDYNCNSKGFAVYLHWMVYLADVITLLY